MNITELQNIDLGIDPITNLKLKGSLLDFYFNPFKSSIIRIRLFINYYDSNDNLIVNERLSEYIKESYSDNNYLVNELGLVDNENGVIGEYDFFINYAETNNVDFFGLIKTKITEAINRGVYY